MSDSKIYLRIYSFFRYHILFGFTLLISGFAFGDTELTVCQLGVEGTSDVFLLPCESYTSQQSCPSSAWLHWSLVSEADKGKLTNAQAALVSGKSVIVRTSGCSAGFDHAYMVRLKK